MKSDFLNLFSNKKPILGMIHLKGEDDNEIFERMKKEIKIYLENEIDCIILENYFGEFHNLKDALKYVKDLNLPIPYGVNCLNVDIMGFELAAQYGASFVQLDSVVGHVKPRDEDTLSAFFQMYKERYNIPVLGGVRFKYQPVLSKNSVEEDLQIAMNRCDAICVTQDVTGQETSLEKIKQFRNAIGDFPLIVGAGVTPENMEKQFKYADGAIVGSYFKENHIDVGEVSDENVKEIMTTVKHIRRELI